MGFMSENNMNHEFELLIYFQKCLSLMNFVAWSDILWSWIWNWIDPKFNSNGNPLQYSCLENPMDRGAWWAAVHGVSKSWTRLSDFTFTFHFHALEKEMAAHSSVLAWRIPGMAEHGELPSMGSHRVGLDWSDLAAAAAAAHHLSWEHHLADAHTLSVLRAWLRASLHLLLGSLPGYELLKSRRGLPNQ